MRFLICARHRATGATSVVSDRAYPTRDDAIAAVSLQDAPGRFADSDLFLIDLEAATPVVIVADGVTLRPGPASDEPGIPQDPIVLEDWPFVDSDAGGVGPSRPAGDLLIEDAVNTEMWWLETGADPDDTAPVGPAVTGSGLDEVPLPADGPEGDRSPIEERAAHVQLRVDLEGWTCTDCIFPDTCPKAGTDRPATCGSFQLKAE